MAVSIIEDETLAMAMAMAMVMAIQELKLLNDENEMVSVMFVQYCSYLSCFHSVVVFLLSSTFLEPNWRRIGGEFT